MSKREKLDANADRGLDVTWEILNLPVAFDNLKLLREQREVALASISEQRRVEEERRRRSKPSRRHPKGARA